LIQDLEKAGFKDRGGKGSHRNYFYPSGIGVTLSGRLGNDAKLYQEKQVKIAIENSSSR